LYSFASIKRIVRAIFSLRWLASIILLLLFDIATYLALRDGSNQPHLFEHADKVFHMLGFTGLSVMGFIALSFDWLKKNIDSYIAVAIINAGVWLLYGCGIEFLQSKLPYRQASLGDLFANLTGILLGLIFIFSLRLYPDLELTDD